MDAEILKIVGQIAGIGGLAIGMIVIIFRRLIDKLVRHKLTREQTYKLLMTIVVCSWSIAVLGIAAWAIVTISETSTEGLAGDTVPDGNVEKWQETRKKIKYLNIYKSAKERGPKTFVNKNGFLVNLRALNFPDNPDIVKTLDELLIMLKNAPIVETGLQQDMVITKDMVDAFDKLFYQIRLEANNQGIRDWDL